MTTIDAILHAFSAVDSEETFLCYDNGDKASKPITLSFRQVHQISCELQNRIQNLQVHSIIGYQHEDNNLNL